MDWRLISALAAAGSSCCMLSLGACVVIASPAKPVENSAAPALLRLAAVSIVPPAGDALKPVNDRLPASQAGGEAGNAPLAFGAEDAMSPPDQPAAQVPSGLPSHPVAHPKNPIPQFRAAVAKVRCEGAPRPVGMAGVSCAPRLLADQYDAPQSPSYRATAGYDHAAGRAGLVLGVAY